MNNNIICGFKYVTPETGKYFIDEHNIRNALDILLPKINNNLISPKKWWAENYGVERSSIKLIIKAKIIIFAETFYINIIQKF